MRCLDVGPHILQVAGNDAALAKHFDAGGFAGEKENAESVARSGAFGVIGKAGGEAQKGRRNDRQSKKTA